mmetsp:Transcript_21763/g.33442  ORF Transcript_21763/g.33442 Transcript_21763/m.33442 type:complete len:389 (-) Transcript_21763:12-1178(-)
MGSSEASLDYLEEYDPSRGVPFSHHLIAGSVAGIAEHGVLFPLDTIKTLRQCSRSPIESLMGDGIRVGTFRLWRGVLAETAACVPAHALFFGGFETVRRVGYATRNQNDLFINGIAGSVATIGHDTIMTPADVVKQRLQLGHHRGVIDATKSLLADGGLAVFYRSYPTTLAMNVPYGCISVAVNEWLKLQWRRYYNIKTDPTCFSTHPPKSSEPLVSNLTKRKEQPADIGLGPLLFSGGIAGAVASLLTTPLDVIKTRLQTQGLDLVNTQSISSTSHRQRCKNFNMGFTEQRSPVHSHHHRLWGCPRSGSRQRVDKVRRHSSSAHSLPLRSASPRLKYHGFLDAAISLWRDEGLMGFFRGATVRTIAQAPSVAIVWTTYELFIKILQQ